MLIILLTFYTLLQVIVGKILFQKVFPRAPFLLSVAGSFLLGIFVSIPITYVLSCAFSFTGEPMLWGMIGFVSSSLLIAYYELRIENRVMHKKNPLSAIRYRALGIDNISDILLFLFSLIFSSWIMFKTFRAGVGGQLFVGSNNVFDFGLFVGLVRSMAWGGNIPLLSPFFAGQPLFYHFFFQFWVALWEYSGIPTVWAVNIPSILSFSALLIIIYYLPQILFKNEKIAGWIAVILTVTHSTLTFWALCAQKGLSVKTFIDIWRLPTYPYAGPFDGSVISIFTTLNNFVNQRHLAFGIAVGLLLYMVVINMIEEKRFKPVLGIAVGFLTGLLFLWNMATCLLVGALIFILFIIHRLWKILLFFIIGSTVMILISLTPYMPYFFQTFGTVNRLVGGTFVINGSVPTWTLVQYLWENLGVLPVVFLFGFIVLPKKFRMYALPFLFFFIIECFLADVGKRGFDQKLYSFLIIGINVVAAIGISYLLKKQILIFYGLAGVALFFLTISGAIDLLALKNEFAYPLINKEMIPVISWIKTKTPKNAVFVSYMDMIDPVVLAGRKNYFGFFGNVGWSDRSPDVKNIYAGDINTAQKLGISYILAPNWNKDDFPYEVDTMYFQEHRMIVYKDAKYSIFAVGN